ncbi:MAG: DEAD/DEAH box helicase, partial [Treponema sp.]|nr:DEAD/DEAH box helicase [Treponema sp.]
MENGFEALGVDPRFIGGLAERNILVPTGIQERVIPRLLRGESLVFTSATGTGKTLAYLLPLLTELSAGGAVKGMAGEGRGQDRKGPVLLILAPTYELCSQIKGELDLLLRSSGPAGSAGRQISEAPLLLTGSGNPARQIDSLKRDKPAFIVGNPGRVLLLARMGKLRFRGLRRLVLDEGDRLTADELLEETGELIRVIRKDAAGELRAVSASATLPAKCRERLIALLGEGTPGEQAPGGGLCFEEGDKTAVLRDFIEHWAIFSESRGKVRTLRSLLAALKPEKALVFTGRGRQAEDIAAQLRYHGRTASA